MERRPCAFMLLTMSIVVCGGMASPAQAYVAGVMVNPSLDTRLVHDAGGLTSAWRGPFDIDRTGRAPRRPRRPANCRPVHCDSRSGRCAFECRPKGFQSQIRVPVR